MKIRILARMKENYSNLRFKEEGKKLNLSVKITDPAECYILIGRKTPTLLKEGKVLSRTDVVVPRMGASISNYGIAVVSQFEMMEVPVLNDTRSILRTRNKLRCIQLMSRYDINIPRTVVLRKPSDLETYVELVGGFPLIVKLISGTQGVGVILAKDMKTVRATIDSFWSMGQEILLQECIAESLGRDIRVVVVGGRVVAAMRRQARLGEFRSNLHLGGLATPIQLDPSYEKAALRASKIVGLEVAGVDILESNEGPKVIEVNSSPGLEGIENATGKNVARAILLHAKEFSTFSFGKRGG